MGKVKIGICCAIFCLLFLSFGFSETILLKSGQKVEGKIIEKADKYVKLDFLGVELVYYNDEIASISQGDLNSEKATSPQLESLYQAYTSSLNVAHKPKENNVESISASVNQQPVQATQITPVVTPDVGLSKLPPEYQKMVQEALKGVQGTQSSQVASGLPLGGDFSKLPPEYQKIIKSTMANMQNTSSAIPEKRSK